MSIYEECLWHQILQVCLFLFFCLWRIFMAYVSLTEDMLYEISIYGECL